MTLYKIVGLKGNYALTIFLVTIFGGLAEVLTLGSFVPFLILLLDDASFASMPIVSHLLELVRPFDRPQGIAILSVVFVFCITVSALLRILLMYFQVRFSNEISGSIALSVYERYLTQPYEASLVRNSSEVITNIQKARDLSYWLIRPILQICTSVIMIIAIVSFLFAVYPNIMSYVLVAVVTAYFMSYLLTHATLKRNSTTLAVSSERLTSVIQEGIDGFREVLMLGRQQFFVARFSKAIVDLQRSLTSVVISSELPRYIIEALGIVSLISIAYLHSISENRAESMQMVTLLGTFAIAAQRLLPHAQTIFMGISHLKGNDASLKDVISIINLPGRISDKYEQNSAIELRDRLYLENIGYRYSPDGPWLFRGVTVVIPKGSRVGIFGASGSGKSTFVDMIQGMVEPVEGCLRIDGTLLRSDKERLRWSQCIASVPQTVFLGDWTISQNIAFTTNDDEIDMERVIESAILTGLHEEILNFNKRYETRVGERGGALSGGQRQRLGIARALYLQRPVLVLDEPTNALDPVNEKLIDNLLLSLPRATTIFLVSHQMELLKNSDILLNVSGEGEIFVKRLHDYRAVSSDE